jgi:PAS domain S-box-containing protein
MLHIVDAHGCIVTVTDHWLRKMGYQREEVIGRSIMDFLSEKYRKELGGGKLREVISLGELNNEDRQMVTRDGKVIDLVMSAISERDSNGNVIRMLVASKDVTERNRAERALRDALAENARLRQEIEHERDYLREEVNVAMNLGRLVGSSPALGHMLEQITAVSQTPANVLILGESGVGKELVARAIHARSPRSEFPLVKVNCASIPKELFESEFFGHVKGAFTGAHRDRIGRFQLADGGTLFLDEVGEIPLELQGKLLRVLQESEFERVGDDQTRRVDVRVIAATNRNLEEAIVKGKFREDLFYRLSVFPIEVPPLRKRGDDIIQLAQHFLTITCQDFGRNPMVLTKAQAEMLRSYDWPGNVRELKNVIERAVILSPKNSLRLDLSLPLATKGPEKRGRPMETPAHGQVHTDAHMRQLMKTNMVAALEQAGWRVSGKGGAAEILGIRPTTLTDRMKAYDIRKPAKKHAGRQ